MTRSRRSGSLLTLTGIALVLVLVPVSGALAASTATISTTPATPVSTLPPADSAPTDLGSCSMITHPGSYVLTDDIETRQRTCLRIEADDVTLDGAGHVVDGHEFRENTTGIAVTGRNVTVRNVTAVNWTFGIEYENASAGTVTNVMTWRTGDGVSVSRSPRMRLRRVTATNGFTGIAVSNSDGSRISDSVVHDTSTSGVFVADSRRVTVTNASVVRSKIGVALLGNRNGNVADTVVRSTADGILLVDSRDNTIRNATLTNPTESAVVTRSNATETESSVAMGTGRFRTRPELRRGPLRKRRTRKTGRVYGFSSGPAG